jgi:triphosphoribosyl-dephospho-CoA synthase
VTAAAARLRPRRAWRVALRQTDVDDSSRIGRLALQALHDELICYPKPGLVSRVDAGSHADMNATTFLRSILALRDYFPAIAAAGVAGAPLSRLRDLGLAAERRMLRSTNGINTHRGAIFSLGFLAAAAGWQRANADGCGTTLGETVRRRWGEAIAHSARDAVPFSHGQRVARHYGTGGARAEAAAGFPHVFAVGLPVFEASLALHFDRERAAMQCFFSIMAQLNDTNLLHRRGIEGLRFAKGAARAFLAEGGVAHPHWRTRAGSLHREFIARGLSPGGSADLLAATLFVHAWKTGRA